MEERLNSISQEIALFQKNQLAINGDIFKQLEEQKHNLQLLLQDLSAFNNRITHLSEKTAILSEKLSSLEYRLKIHEHEKSRSWWYKR